MTVLALVKHAVKSVMHTLNEGDRLAVVAFNHTGQVKLNLTEMTPDGRVEATAALDGLHASGRTNIWDGLLKGR